MMDEELPGLRSALGQSHRNPTADDVEAFAASVPLRIDQILGTLETSRPVAAPTVKKRSWHLGFAAAGAVAAAVAGVAYITTSQGVPQVIQYATAIGEVRSVNLPDGSVITLAPQSQLRYSINRQSGRHLTLDGLAHFSVAHDPEQPFVVLSGGVETQVLGTAFEIDTDRGAYGVRVALAEGKIGVRRVSNSVRTSPAPLLLTPGDVVEFTDSGVIKRAINPAQMGRWVHGELVFQDAPIPDMLKTIGRWYGYEFRMADSALAARHVTTTLVTGNPAELIRALRDLLDVTVTVNGTIVTLTPRTRNRRAVPERKHRVTPQHERRQERTAEVGR